MRLLHTSDWHLGRRLCEVSLLEDQAWVLDRLLELARDQRVDGLVVAGDVFDRAVPPEQAVELWAGFVERVIRDLGVPLVVIPGNHDSALRLGAHAGLLEPAGYHMRCRFDRRADPVRITSREGETAAVFCLPWAEPDQVRAELAVDTPLSHDAAAELALRDMIAARAVTGADHAVLVSHLFAQGGLESESERTLVVGGSGQVGAHRLVGWDYVALGHLHQPQRVGGSESIRYSGSLLKYSFGEARHRKGVTVVELTPGQPSRAESIELGARRDVVRLRGTFEELLRGAEHAHAESAYVEATYTDRDYLIDVAPRLRERFPHLLLALPELIVGAEGGSAASEPRLDDHRALLGGFWQHVLAEEPEESLVDAFAVALGGATRVAQEEEAA